MLFHVASRYMKRTFRCLFSNNSTEERLLKAVVLGAPNAGKSTLINTLIGQKVFPVSQKVHTTRQNGLGMFTSGNCQVILTDTPGLIPYQYGRRLKMSKSFLTGAQSCTEQAQLILVVVDATNKRTRLKLDNNVLQVLKKHSSLPASLVLNKIDIMRHKSVLLQVTSDITEHIKTHLESDYRFKNVFMISGLTGNGVDSLKDYLLTSCTPCSWEYGSNDVTDQTPETIVEEIVRERIFQHLDKEIPYVIKQSTVIWESGEEGKLTILKNLDCKKSSQASIVIGPKGETIQAITSEAQTILESMLNKPIDLTLNVRSVN